MKDSNQVIKVLKDGRVSVKTINNDPTKTQQQFKDECDINNIMNKYTSTGQFTHLTSKQGTYGDFSQITDYQEMLHTVKYAQDAFAALPADIRKRFNNDPGQLLEFVQNDKNYDEGVKLGLVQPKNPPPPIPPSNPNELNETKTKPKTTKPNTDQGTES